MNTNRHSAAQSLLTLSLTTLATCLTGCAGHELDQLDSGTTPVFEVGEEFDVALRYSHSGMSWDHEVSDPSVLRLVDQESSSDGDGEGAGGTDYFTFDCIAPGTSRLDMFQVFPGGDPEPEPDFTIEVVVR